MVVGTLTSLFVFLELGIGREDGGEVWCVCEIVFFVVLGFLCFFVCVLWGFELRGWCALTWRELIAPACFRGDRKGGADDDCCRDRGEQPKSVVNHVLRMESEGSIRGRL